MVRVELELSARLEVLASLRASMHASPGIHAPMGSGSRGIIPPDIAERLEYLASLRSELSTLQAPAARQQPQAMPRIGRGAHVSSALGQAAIEMRADLASLNRSYDARRSSLEAMRSQVDSMRSSNVEADGLATELAAAARAARQTLRSGRPLSDDAIEATDRALAQAVRRGGVDCADDDGGGSRRSARWEDADARIARAARAEGERCVQLLQTSYRSSRYTDPRARPATSTGAGAAGAGGPSIVETQERDRELTAARERMRRRGVLSGASSTPSPSLLDRGGSMFTRLQQVRESSAQVWVAPGSSAVPAQPPVEEHVLRALRPQPLRNALADVCSVCLEPMLQGHPVVTLECRHSFHSKCLLPWLLRCACCPMCKVIVRGPKPAEPSVSERPDTRGM